MSAIYIALKGSDKSKITHTLMGKLREQSAKIENLKNSRKLLEQLQNKSGEPYFAWFPGIGWVPRTQNLSRILHLITSFAYRDNPYKPFRARNNSDCLEDFLKLIFPSSMKL